MSRTLTPRASRKATPRATDGHREWLGLVDTDGPFLALPTLKRVYPQGIPTAPAGPIRAVRDVKPTFERAWDDTHAAWVEGQSGPVSSARADPAPALEKYRTARDLWVRTVLRDVLGWGEHVVEGTGAVTLCATTSPDGQERVAPNFALAAAGSVGALVLVVDPVEDMRVVLPGRWAASPIDRMEALLRAPEAPCTVGLVTDGRWWALVSAAEGTMSASGVVDSLTWAEETGVRDAFIELLSVRRLLGGREEDRLPAMFAESVLAAEEVTEALGVQVRQAVELLVAAFSEGAREALRRDGADPLPEEAGSVYDAAVTVMMRIVFLLFAEERGLLPGTALFQQAYGMAGQLDALEQRAREGEEVLEDTSLVWHRLLATSRALAAGANFEDVRLPAYGGSLFDEARFPFLAQVTPQGTLAVTVPDRVMLHALRAVQIAHVKAGTGNRGGHVEARRISFRDIDVEQIGYVYEGLLGYTCARAEETIVGLIGKAGDEPEIPLSVLDGFAERCPDDAAIAKATLDWVKKDQPSLEKKLVSVAALAKAFGAGDAVEDAERALLQVSRDDAALRETLRTWVGAIRRDLRGRPTVFQPGDVYVVETPSRKNAGAHYTPRSLAEEVVVHALQPLVYQPGPYQTSDSAQWRLLPPSRILQLKVADIACGSGAFLVAAARYLAERLVEAWHEEGVRTPAGQLLRRALREVVASCLYGVDINEMAVEMCKLSLWLVSLDPQLPFSFVDHKIRVGNSLLGVTDLRQVRALHIEPAAVPTQQGVFDLAETVGPVEGMELDRVVEEAAEQMRELSQPVMESDPQRSARAKARTLERTTTTTASARRVADSVIAAGLALGGKPGKKLDAAYENLRIAVERDLRTTDPDGAMLDALLERGLTPTATTDYARWECLHWPLVFPEVFGRGGDFTGFDAVIGNPPFLGGKKLTPALGQNVREWYVYVLATGTKGNADLVAYFFLRSMALLNARGTLGLIATNTVAQGDTREVGLDRMVADGFTITRAVQSEQWPSASAALEYAAVWGTRGSVKEGMMFVSNGEEVRQISTLLEAVGRVEGSPVALQENKGLAFQGCVVLGKGFVIPPEEAHEWNAQDPQNAEVLFPYLNGENLNSRPDGSASRWVIDFGERTEQAAARYARPWEHVTAAVRPERMTKDAEKYPRMVHEWWKFWNGRPGLRKAVADLDEVLAIALVSKTVMPLRVSTGQVFSHALGVFATDSFAAQAVLSSSLHQAWAIRNGSGMRNDPRYTPTDVFETFPRPERTPALEAIGRTLDEERREIMLRRQLGLTDLYNLVNSPAVAAGSDRDVDRLREIHRDLDETVTAAYSWDDLQLEHGFHTYRKMTRWTVAPAARIELLDRLLEENHRRAASASQDARLNSRK